MDKKGGLLRMHFIQVQDKFVEIFTLTTRIGWQEKRALELELGKKYLQSAYTNYDIHLDYYNTQFYR